MTEVRVAFLWHHHQPCYRDLFTGRALMPWVRLHAVKDYYGMARILADRGGASRATFNFVPSLIDQIEAFVAGAATDPHLELSRKPAEALTPAERAAALDLFFMVNHERLIRPRPRYRELLARRRPGHVPASHAVADFTTEDLRDLQVLGNLAWFHELLLREDPLLKELSGKGRGYTEEEKLALLDRQREVAAGVLPLHAKLAREGIAGLVTSPYYHPILPLLVRMESARVALPGARLPSQRRPLPDDARTQLERAVRRHEATFGVRPTGLWPSEGSVSPEILPLVKEAGFSWLASDQDVLAASRGEAFRDGDHLEPWRLDTPAGPLAMVFRDHRLSDRIGFEYQRMDAGAAAQDFVARVRDLARGRRGPVLVPVILDGENAWEHYAEGGVPFLTRLYEEIERARGISTVLFDEELLARPPRSALPRLHSGSWIHADFHIWIGHDEDVRAWDYLYRVREDLVRIAAEKPPADPAAAKALESAWECLYAAEGSDYTWWYGEDHDSGIDEKFDELYRTHLANVYRFLGEPVPPFLAVPVSLSRRTDALLEPVAFLDVSLDGRDTTYFEWLAAGRYRTANGRTGAMSRAEGSGLLAGGLLADLRFGFNASTLFLRVDFGPGWRKAAERLPGAGPLEMIFQFAEPAARTLVVRDLAGQPSLDLDGEGPPARGGVAVDAILEVACPFAVLGLRAGDPVAFHVELRRGNAVFERLPGSETVRFSAPAADYGADRWQV